MSDENGVWRCRVCGYIHHGTQPPESCPICGAPASDFEASVQPAPKAAQQAPGAWRCLNCSYVHSGAAPPDECPVCGARHDRFVPAQEDGDQADGGYTGRIAVLGAGIAGVAAVEAIARVAPAAQVSLIGAEDELPYYRLNLTRYLAGAQDRAALAIHPRSWYEERGVALHLGTQVASIDTTGKRLLFADGAPLGWDRLVLAAGAHPFVPPLPGNELPGVHCIRTLADVEAVRERCGKGLRCVCIGGGILGMEVAAALAAQGAQVELLEGHGWLMPRQLDRRAGELLQEHAANMGITVINEARVARIHGDERAHAVVLDDGASHPADLVTVTTGVRPNTHLARRIGLDVRRGVVVDNHMRSSCPDIFAAGDIAEHAGTVYGLWTPAQSMGAIAGMNAAGAAAEFGGIPRSNTVKVIGADVFSIGTIEPPDGSYRVVSGEDGGVYRRFVVRDGCLVGAVLFGASELAAAVRIAVEEGLDVAPALANDDAGELAAFLAERA